MEYGSYQELKDLVSDSNATEFRDNAEYLPLNKTGPEFVEWIDSDALPAWGPQYQPMLDALKSLVAAASELDYADAIKAITALVPPAPPHDPQAEQPDNAELAAEVEEDEEVPDPGEAAKRAAQNITAPIIEDFRRQHPEIAARLTPEELSAMAMKATAAVVGEN